MSESAFVLMAEYSGNALCGSDPLDDLVVLACGSNKTAIEKRRREIAVRYKKAQNEWDEWDDIKTEWSISHESKLEEINKKYDLPSGLALVGGDVRFTVLETENASED